MNCVAETGREGGLHLQDEGACASSPLNDRVRPRVPRTPGPKQACVSRRQVKGRTGSLAGTYQVFSLQQKRATRIYQTPELPAGPGSAPRPPYAGEPLLFFLLRHGDELRRWTENQARTPPAVQ